MPKIIDISKCTPEELHKIVNKINEEIGVKIPDMEKDIAKAERLIDIEREREHQEDNNMEEKGGRK
jgi:hypothetical protein